MKKRKKRWLPRVSFARVPSALTPTLSDVTKDAMCGRFGRRSRCAIADVAGEPDLLGFVTSVMSTG